MKVWLLKVWLLKVWILKVWLSKVWLLKVWLLKVWLLKVWLSKVWLLKVFWLIIISLYSFLFLFTHFCFSLLIIVSLSSLLFLFTHYCFSFLIFVSLYSLLFLFTHFCFSFLIFVSLSSFLFLFTHYCFSLLIFVSLYSFSQFLTHFFLTADDSQRLDAMPTSAEKDSNNFYYNHSGRMFFSYQKNFHFGALQRKFKNRKWHSRDISNTGIIRSELLAAISWRHHWNTPNDIVGRNIQNDSRPEIVRYFRAKVRKLEGPGERRCRGVYLKRTVSYKRVHHRDTLIFFFLRDFISQKNKTLKTLN